MKIKVKVNGEVLIANLENNSSAEALCEKLKAGEITAILSLWG